MPIAAYLSGNERGRNNLRRESDSHLLQLYGYLTIDNNGFPQRLSNTFMHHALQFPGFYSFKKNRVIQNGNSHATALFGHFLD